MAPGAVGLSRGEVLAAPAISCRSSAYSAAQRHVAAISAESLYRSARSPSAGWVCEVVGAGRRTMRKTRTLFWFQPGLIPVQSRGFNPKSYPE